MIADVSVGYMLKVCLIVKASFTMFYCVLTETKYNCHFIDNILKRSERYVKVNHIAALKEMLEEDYENCHGIWVEV